MNKEYVSPYFKVGSDLIDVRKITHTNNRYIYFNSPNFCLKLDKDNFEKIKEHMENYARQESNFAFVDSSVNNMLEQVNKRIKPIENYLHIVDKNLASFAVKLNENSDLAVYGVRKGEKE